MSVVNQMLRDLQKHEGNKKALPLRDVEPSMEHSFQLTSKIWVFILISFGSLGYLYKNELLAFLSLPETASIHPTISQQKTNTQNATHHKSVQSQNSPEAKFSNTHTETKSKENLPSVVTSRKSNANVLAIDSVAVNKVQKNSPQTLLSFDETTTLPLTADSNIIKTNTTSKIKPKNKSTTLSTELTSQSNKKIHEAKSNEKSPLTNDDQISKIESSVSTSDIATVKKTSLNTQLNDRVNSILNQQAVLGVDASKKALIQILAEYPSYHHARLTLLNLLWQNNQIETEYQIQLANKEFPNYYAYKLLAARYFIQKKEIDKANRLFSDLNPENIQFADALKTRAIIKQQLNKHQEAINDYAQLLQIQPRSGDIFLALGLSFEAMSQPEQALLSFKKAVEVGGLNRTQIQFAQSKIQYYQG